MKILVFDLGGQYSHLIWRNLRDLETEAYLVKKNFSYEKVLDYDAIIFSGGPSSVTSNAYDTCEIILSDIKKGNLSKPVLGICLGHQLIAHRFGGNVEKGKKGEYGLIQVEIIQDSRLLENIERKFDAWASHFDVVSKLPDNFILTAITSYDKESICEAIEHERKDIFSVQFHPEVYHTKVGVKIFENFVKIAKK
ncbi:MAG: GMP synthase subunit A [Candidatus Anstonellales archaeon]